jgi:hypothetical protein
MTDNGVYVYGDDESVPQERVPESTPDTEKQKEKSDGPPGPAKLEQGPFSASQGQISPVGSNE